jgi:hypothetical protein
LRGITLNLIVPEEVDHDGILLNDALFKRHEVEHERGRLGNPIWQARASAIISAQM